MVSHEQIAFARQTPQECVVVVVNAADTPVPFELALPAVRGSQLRDVLNEGECFPVHGGKARLDAVRPCWSRIMVVE